MGQTKHNSLGIIGIGTVGRALAEALPGALLYDKYKQIGSEGKINKATILFVCVPTPHNKKNGFDVSELENAFSFLSEKKIVVIRSTALPGTTEEIQKKYPQHKVLFNPEFLRHAYAKEDTLHPQRQIVGFTKQSKEVAKEILAILPKAPAEYIISASEAEMVKYFGNAFLATKVIFANQFYELCRKLGLDYDTIKKCVAADPRIGSSHLDIFSGGYRGYGGDCFYKDMKSLIYQANKLGIPLELLEIADNINETLLENSKNKRK